MNLAKFSLMLVGVYGLCQIAVSDEKQPVCGNCPFSGKAATADKFAEYRGAKVYFCCPGCADHFKKDSSKVVAKANHQLALTGQFVQQKCPLSGGAVKDEANVDVGGVKVKFCCDKCQGKVAAGDKEGQLNMVFADTPFDKAFALKK